MLRPRGTVAATLIFVFLVIAAPITGATSIQSTASSTTDFDVSASVPSQTTVGQSTTIGASATIPDLVGTYNPDLTFTLYVDGTKVDQQTVTGTDGGTVDTSFSYSFDNAGSHEIEIKGSTTFAGRDFGASVTNSIDVQQPDIGSLDLSTSISGETTVGSDVTATSTISLPSVSGTDVSGDVIVSLKHGGTTVDSQTVTLGDGGAKTLDLTTSFSSSGDKTLTVAASGSIAGQSVSADVTKTVSISPPSIDSISVSASVPSSTTVGESTTLSTTVSVPEVSPSVSGDITMTVLADGTSIGEQTVTVGDGESKTVTFSHAFQSDGDTSLTFEASGSVAGQSVSASTTKSLTVENPSIGSLELSADAPSTVTVGKTADVETTVSIPSVSGTSLSGDITVTLARDGEQVASQIVTLSDGGSTTLTFSPTFDTAGETTLTLEASGSVGDQSLSATASKTVSVEEETSTDITVSGNLTVPEKATTGEETTIEGSVSLTDVPDAITPTVTAELLANGTVIASQEVTVEGTKPVSFTPTFSSSGPTDVTLRITGELAGQSISKEVMKNIDVEKPGRSLETPGVVFKTPTSLEDEVAAYREQLGLGSDVKAFILAKQNALYLVFTTTTPEKGIATVTGRTTEQDLSYDGFTLDLVVATSVSYDQTGEPATVDEVSETPDEYRLDLVRFSTEHRRLSVLTDPDQGEDFTASTTIGTLVANPKSTSAFYEDMTDRARTLAQHPNETTARRVLNNPEGSYLPTFTFSSTYWSAAPATVDGIVLNPSSRAYEFANSLDSTGLVSYAEGSDVPAVYVVRSEIEAQSFDSVRKLASNADSLDGEEVTITGRVYQGRVSVQETAEHATTSQCSEDLLTVQTPNGPACVNVAADVVAEGGVVWTTVPESRDDILLTLGLSARHQDQPTLQTNGRYKITGELVSTSRINESLPDRSVLIVHEAERVGDIDYEAVASEARSIIEDRVGQVTKYNQRSAGKSIPLDGQTDSKTGESGTVDIGFDPSDSGGVSTVTVNETSGDTVTMTAESVASLPDSLPAPPVDAVRTLNLTSSVADSSIQDATVSVVLSQDAIDQPSTVAVFRYHNESWNELPTSVVKQNQTHVIIEFTTPGFSYFTVGSASETEETTTTTTPATTTTPETTTQRTTKTTARTTTASQTAPEATTNPTETATTAPSAPTRTVTSTPASSTTQSPAGQAAGKQSKNVSPSDDESGSTPGFTIIGILVALLTLGVRSRIE
jgi:PGF-pre-PGF domain-containing protein